MTVKDMLKVLKDTAKYLPEAKQKFVAQMVARQARCLVISPAQAHYLQVCYDDSIGAKYQLGPDPWAKEEARERSIRKRQRERSRGV